MIDRQLGFFFNRGIDLFDVELNVLLQGVQIEVVDVLLVFYDVEVFFKCVIVGILGGDFNFIDVVVLVYEKVFQIKVVVSKCMG